MPITTEEMPECITQESDPIRRVYLKTRMGELEHAVGRGDRQRGGEVIAGMVRRGFTEESDEILEWLVVRKIARVASANMARALYVALMTTCPPGCSGCTSMGGGRP